MRRKNTRLARSNVDVVLVVLGLTIACVSASLERGAAEHGDAGEGPPGRFWEWRLPVGCDYSGFFLEMLGCLAELIRRTSAVALNTGACSEAMLWSLAPGEERAVRRATAAHAAASELPRHVIHAVLHKWSPRPQPKSPPVLQPSEVKYFAPSRLSETQPPRWQSGPPTCCSSTRSHAHGRCSRRGGARVW
jgi:hypothetical protein